MTTRSSAASGRRSATRPTSCRSRSPPRSWSGGLRSVAEARRPARLDAPAGRGLAHRRARRRGPRRRPVRRQPARPDRPVAAATRASPGCPPVPASTPLPRRLPGGPPEPGRAHRRRPSGEVVFAQAHGPADGPTGASAESPGAQPVTPSDWEPSPPAASTPSPLACLGTTRHHARHAESPSARAAHRPARRAATGRQSRSRSTRRTARGRGALHRRTGELAASSFAPTSDRPRAARETPCCHQLDRRAWRSSFASSTRPLRGDSHQRGAAGMLVRDYGTVPARASVRRAGCRAAAGPGPRCVFGLTTAMAHPPRRPRRTGPVRRDGDGPPRRQAVALSRTETRSSRQRTLGTRFSLLITSEAPPVALVRDYPAGGSSRGLEPRLWRSTTRAYHPSRHPGATAAGRVHGRARLRRDGVDRGHIDVGARVIAPTFPPRSLADALFVAQCIGEGATTSQTFHAPSTSDVRVFYEAAPGQWIAMSILVPEGDPT